MDSCSSRSEAVLDDSIASRCHCHFWYCSSLLAAGQHIEAPYPRPAHWSASPVRSEVGHSCGRPLRTGRGGSKSRIYSWFEIGSRFSAQTPHRWTARSRGGHMGNGSTVSYRSYGGGKQLNTIWQNVTWDIARAGGFTAYILLTLAVIVGLALSTQIQSPSRWPRLLNSELHNFLTLLSTIFLVVHVLATWVDPFTRFSWNEILIPLTSHYRPEWMAFGIMALYLGIAIGISTWLRPHIGYKVWRRLHVLTLGIFALATIHGIGTGSDTQTPWALGIYLVSLVLVGSLFCRRVFFSKGKRQRVPVQSITPARGVRAVPQSNLRTLDGARITAVSTMEQNRTEVARVK